MILFTPFIPTNRSSIATFPSLSPTYFAPNIPQGSCYPHLMKCQWYHLIEWGQTLHIVCNCVSKERDNCILGVGIFKVDWWLKELKTFNSIFRNIPQIFFLSNFQDDFVPYIALQGTKVFLKCTEILIRVKNSNAVPGVHSVFCSVQSSMPCALAVFVYLCILYFAVCNPVCLVYWQ